MVVVPDLRAAHAAEKFLRPIRASAVEAIGFLVVDPLHFKAACNSFQLAAFIRVHDRALGDARADEIERRPSVRNTAGSVLPSRSRMTTTALRLPD